MAGITAFLSNTSPVTVAAGVATSILQLKAASNHRCLVKQIVVSMKHDAQDAPTNGTARVDICRNSAIGTMTLIAPIKQDETVDETLQASGTEDDGATPTIDDILWSEEINPFLGGQFRFDALRREDMIAVKGGHALGIQITTDWPTDAADFIAKITYEE